MNRLLPILFLAGFFFWCPCPVQSADLFGLSPDIAPEQKNTPLRPLAGIRSATGLWETPTARILPDWNFRIQGSHVHPYRRLGFALGLLDRLEVSADLTEVGTIEAFPGENFGPYKDRALGARLVIARESRALPQLAIGAYDIGGTEIFASRYAVLSRRFGSQSAPVDVHLGVGQGLLGNEAVSGTRPQDVPENADFLTSSPIRKTRIFGGLSYAIHPEFRVVAEYSPIRASSLFGHPDDSKSPFVPLNIGIKTTYLDPIILSAALMHGKEPAFSIGFQAPLSPEGLHAWKKQPQINAGERLRAEAANATPGKLSRLAAEQLEQDGFLDVYCSSTQSALWCEAANTVSLSDTRALTRMGRILEDLAPPRITELFLCRNEDGMFRLGLQTGRTHLRAYLESRIDTQGFLEFARLDQDRTDLHAAFAETGTPSRFVAAGVQEWLWSVEPKIRTYMGNRRGYLKHKAFLELSAGYKPTPERLITGRLDWILHNGFTDLAGDPLEPYPVRSDASLYEQDGGIQLATLAYDRIVELPFGMYGRYAAGWFETAYAGIAGETYRSFSQGRFGIGAEAELVSKRNPDSFIGLLGNSGTITGYLNLYTQLSPRYGLDAGLRLGRFLGRDWGGRLELRRTARHYTIGTWYTYTDTSSFHSPKNKGFHEQGIFIRIPFSIFSDTDQPGAFNYAITNFTRDAGQMVSQPRSLFPMSPEGSPAFERYHLRETRQ